MEIEPFECFTAVPGRLAEGMVDVEAVNKEDDAVHRVTDAKNLRAVARRGLGVPEDTPGVTLNQSYVQHQSMSIWHLRQSFA